MNVMSICNELFLLMLMMTMPFIGVCIGNIIVKLFKVFAKIGR